jgi:hypothetical protein
MTDITLQCAQCGSLFIANRHQRSKFRRSGGIVKSCCSYECICAFRAAMFTKPSGHYAKECCECGRQFQATHTQIHRRNKDPDCKLVCSVECLRTHRVTSARSMHKEGKLTWGSPAQVSAFEFGRNRTGSAHPSWKTGITSKQMREVASLMHKIRTYIKQGANQ